MHLKLAIKKEKIKTLMLPIAMIGGAVFYKWLGYLTFLSPFLIFMMLFITYCKLEIRDFKPSKEHLILLGVQIVLSLLIYFAMNGIEHTVAEGVFICVFIPTATAAPVITSMLGGSISFVATYSLLCNAFVALFGPFIFAAVGDNSDMTLLQSTLIICKKVFPLLILPLVAAMGLKYFVPRLHSKVVGHQQLSFYLWAVSLFIIVGSCVSFTINNWNINQLPAILGMVAAAFVVCLLQFFLGRKIGAKFGDKISGGQSLGQKNTVLAVWIAMTYMNPISSLAPASYIAWQNIVNSAQLIRKSKRHEKKKEEIELTATNH